MYVPVVIVVYFGASFWSLHLLGNISYAPLFRWLAFDVLFYSGIQPVATAAMLGLRMFREVTIIGLGVQSIFRQILIISLLVLMRNFVGLVIGWVVSDAAMGFIQLVCVVRALGGPQFNFPLGKLLGFSLPLELAGIVNYGQTWFDRVLVAIFVPLSTLGVYNAALTAFGVLAGVSGAMINTLYPIYSSIQGKPNGRTNLREGIRLATRYASLTLTPLAFGLLVTAKPAIALFIGESYAAGSMPLAILCGGFAITAFTTAFIPVLSALGETKVTARIVAISVAVGIVIGYVLLPMLGILGAATARALEMIISAVITFRILNSKLTLNIDGRAIAKHLLSGAVMATVLEAVQLVRYSRFLLPLYLVIGLVVYVIMLRALKAVDVADLNLLQGLLGKRLSPISRILRMILLAGISS